MKVKALLELLADYDPEMDVLLVRACPGDGVVSLLPDGQDPCREKPLVVPFLRISDIDPCRSLADLHARAKWSFWPSIPASRWRIRWKCRWRMKHEHGRDHG